MRQCLGSALVAACTRTSAARPVDLLPTVLHGLLHGIVHGLLHGLLPTVLHSLHSDFAS